MYKVTTCTCVHVVHQHSLIPRPHSNDAHRNRKDWEWLGVLTTLKLYYTFPHSLQAGSKSGSLCVEVELADSAVRYFINVHFTCSHLCMTTHALPLVKLFLQISIGRSQCVWPSLICTLSVASPSPRWTWSGRPQSLTLDTSLS